MVKRMYNNRINPPSKVGSILASNICRCPERCSICSTRYWKLTPLQKKKILAHIKHDPTKVTPTKSKRICLSAKQIKSIKQSYIKPHKPIDITDNYYDIDISQEDLLQSTEK